MGLRRRHSEEKRRYPGGTVLLVGVLATILAGGLPFVGLAAEAVDVEAGVISYENDGRVVNATGGVIARWGDKQLRAESLRFERDGARLRADGELVLETPDLTLRADSCDLDLNNETGVLRGVSLRSNNSPARFGGLTVEKLRGNRYVLRDGYYTTCEARENGAPDWDLAGRRVNIEVNGRGSVRGGTFRIRGVPVLYIPYLSFPTKVKRQTGLLLPRVGLSNARGFIYSQPLFWAIDKHQDVTVTFDLETAARIGTELQYRYNPRRRVGGTVEIAAYNERIRGDPRSQIVSPLFEGRPIPENRAMALVKHRQELSPGVDLYLDALLVSDDLLLREVESVATRSERRALLRSRRYTDSRLGVIGRDGFASYGARTRFYQDFIGADRLTLQRPLELWGARDGELGAGVGYTLGATLSTFYRVRGNDGQRFDLVADLERPLLRGLPVHASVWSRGRLTAYRMNDQTVVDTTGVAVDEIDRHMARMLAEGGVDVKTVFARRFALPSALTGLVAGRRRKSGHPGPVLTTVDHTIEPFAKIRATTGSSDGGLPLYDEIDRIDGRTVATYGVASRFLLPSDKGNDLFEAARISAEQSYNLDDRVVDDYFSDLDLTLSLRSRRGYAVRGLASYNVGQGRLMGAASAVSFERFRLPFTNVSDSRVQAVYRFVQGEVLETAEGRAIFALTQRFSVGFNGRYDFVSSSFVESGGGVRYRSGCRCWAIDFGVVNRVNPDELQVRVEVELSGLGSLGSSPLFKTSQRLGALYGVDRGYRRVGW